MLTLIAKGSMITPSFDVFARVPDEALDVALGAALIAKDVDDAVDVSALLAELDELAGPLTNALVGKPLREQAEAVSGRYCELGFRGNTDDYYDPKNSLLSSVVERRVGIPITLAIVWCAIARSAGVFARGIGFPGHFLARVDRGPHEAPVRRAVAAEFPGTGGGAPLPSSRRTDEAEELRGIAGGAPLPSSRRREEKTEPPVIVDPFEGGRVVDDDEARMLLRRSLGQGAELHSGYFEAATARMTLVRMLTNLKGIWANQGDHTRAFVAIDRMVTLVPDSARLLRERAAVALKLGIHELARTDLARVVELDPRAPDVAAIKRRLAGMKVSGPTAPN